MRKGRKVMLLSSLAALGIAAALAVVGRRQIADWLAPPRDPGRELVTLDLEWDPKGAVRCRTSPYLRPDGEWLEVHEFPMDPRTSGPRVPDLGELGTYLELRRRDLVPLFGEPGRLAVLVNFHREVPWTLVTEIAELCERLGITDVDVDPDD